MEEQELKMQPKVSIIILNWNGAKDTLECLESIYKLDYPNSEVIVVDNGSTDESVQIIRRIYPATILIENKENLGYTGGNNMGMRYAIENGAQYTWLLNNDTVVEPNSLSELISAAERSVDIGLLSPCIYFYDKPDRIQFCGAVVEWEKKDVSNIEDLGLLKNDKIIRGIVLWGTALLIKRDVIERVGFLDERYFAYHEDIEYSLRAIMNGYTNIVTTSSKVYHKYARSTGGRDSPGQCYFMTRNKYFLWMGNLRGLDRFYYLRKYISDTISLANEFREKQKIASANACLDGMWNALMGITGPWDKKIKIPYIMKRILLAHPFFWADLLSGDYMNIMSELFRRVRLRIPKI